MKERVTKIITIIFPDLTLERAALFVRTLIFNCWTAMGNVATNFALQYFSAVQISKDELLRSLGSQLLPVVIALLWPSPLQRFQKVIVQQTTTTSGSEARSYIAPHDISEEDSK
jgi:hypothetical protein